MKKDRYEETLAIRAAWIAVSRALIAAFLSGVFTLMDSYLFSNYKATDKLISILNLRAQNILEKMDKEKEEALNEIKKGHGRVRRAEWEKLYFLEKIDSARTRFSQLQQKHTEALREGNLVLAREILTDNSGYIGIMRKFRWKLHPLYNFSCFSKDSFYI